MAERKRSAAAILRDVLTLVDVKDPETMTVRELVTMLEERIVAEQLGKLGGHPKGTSA